ncbi:uncharacterized protein B0I36DRAFT_431919 [Microdochium trichocladiopsis]|uniref:Uncharacterized protein n=1 Tax=Microdochium trichocladiopsis TaxID=1682393 RepID=A0A9P9BSN7_9PEZI|nr:uncharacterized protein B0I36DRAFT_431919 [Microdochium trichocladiopsis]KAH7029021.1 hypothetical protein B0I36DRAFT_431919 [Microdochium trichocladiopsis]
MESPTWQGHHSCLKTEAQVEKTLFHEARPNCDEALHGGNIATRQLEELKATVSQAQQSITALGAEVAAKETLITALRQKLAALESDSANQSQLHRLEALHREQDHAELRVQMNNLGQDLGKFKAEAAVNLKLANQRQKKLAEYEDIIKELREEAKTTAEALSSISRVKDKRPQNIELYDLRMQLQRSNNALEANRVLTSKALNGWRAEKPAGYVTSSSHEDWKAFAYFLLQFSDAAIKRLVHNIRGTRRFWMETPRLQIILRSSRDHMLPQDLGRGQAKTCALRPK